MPKRRFDQIRANRLSRRLVLIVSALCGLFGIYGLLWLGSSAPTDITSRAGKECINSAFDFSVQAACLSEYYKIVDGMNSRTFWALGIAIGLPTLFFGGIWLRNYLFPKLKK